MPSFNLVTEPWIPCAERAGGAPRLLSLGAVFAEAPRLAAVAGPSPAVAISLYRLLLAILHRSLDGPRSIAAWRTVWERGHWDHTRIDAYLRRWHKRFDLFDLQYPFYQTPGLDRRAVRPATLLAHERASCRNRALLFDHSSAGDATLSAAEAARYLIAMQNFAVSGLISLGRGVPVANKFATAAPLLGAAITLVQGQSLFHTLMLNWVRYNREEGEAPFPFSEDDKPAWERADGGARPEDRLPDGYVDLLTWQSRRILLLPDTASSAATASPVPADTSRQDPRVPSDPRDIRRTTLATPDTRESPDTPHTWETHETRVGGAVMMKGFQLAPGFEQWRAESMLAFRKSTATVKSAPPWFAVGLSPGRLVWRDSLTLIQSVPETRRPQVIDWLSTLVKAGLLDEHTRLSLAIYGLIPDRATITEWRRDTLPLPLRLLDPRPHRATAAGTVAATEQQLRERLGQALALAEEVARCLDAAWVT